MAATRIRKGPSGTFVDVGGGSDEGVTSVRWVDPATTLDPADQTGSAVAPYSTLAAAMTSLQLAAVGTVVGTIICADGDYQAEELTWTIAESDQRLEVMGFGGAFNFSLSLAADGLGGFLVLSGLGRSAADTIPLTSTAGNTPVQIRDCYIGAIAGVALQITQLEGSRVYGAVSVDRLLGVADSEFFSTVLLASGILTANNTRFLDTVTCDAGGDVLLKDCVCFGRVSTAEGGTHIAKDTEFRAGLAWAGLTFEATDCLFTGDEETPAITGAGGIIQGGRCDLAIESNVNTLELYDVIFGGVGEAPATVDAQAAIINGCVLNEVTVVGELQIDTTSYQQAIDGTTVTAGTLIFTDPPFFITLSIVVPAVAADAVGYVNTSLVGTAFEDVFAVGDPVVVNPTSDLVAAGAGGGFINARISGANVLRSAFNGALAGGAANFTVARVR